MIGIVAGNGNLPVRCVRRIKESGEGVVAVAHKGESTRNFQREVDDCLWVKFGELDQTIRFFKEKGVKQIVFAGGISRTGLFFNFRPDTRAIALIKKLGNLRDDAVLRAIASEFESEGFEILPLSRYVTRSSERIGLITSRRLTGEEMRDAVIGWQAAGLIGEADIGQTVVVNGGTVVAVEGVEGTDATILRAGKLSGRGSVVVKRCKPGQDLRFDLPTIGPKTIKMMKKAGAKALILESSNSIVLDTEITVTLSNRYGISILLCSKEEELSTKN